MHKLRVGSVEMFIHDKNIKRYGMDWNFLEDGFCVSKGADMIVKICPRQKNFKKIFRKFFMGVLILFSLFGCDYSGTDLDRKLLRIERFYQEKWEDGIITYRLSGFNEDESLDIKRAIHAWEKLTGCLTFVETEDGELNILKGSVNASFWIGHNRLNNFVELCDGFSIETTIHELGHVIGLIHEHQRPDRDSYVTVTEMNQNYMKIDPLYDYKKIPYDKHSIMHYPDICEDCGGDVITKWDIMKVQDIYGKPEKNTSEEL